MIYAVMMPMAVASPQEEIRAQTKDRCRNSGNWNKKGCYRIAADKTDKCRYTIATHGTDTSTFSIILNFVVSHLFICLVITFF